MNAQEIVRKTSNLLSLAEYSERWRDGFETDPISSVGAIPILDAVNQFMMRFTPIGVKTQTFQIVTIQGTTDYGIDGNVTDIITAKYSSNPPMYPSNRKALESSLRRKSVLFTDPILYFREGGNIVIAPAPSRSGEIMTYKGTVPVRELTDPTQSPDDVPITFHHYIPFGAAVIMCSIASENSFNKDRRDVYASIADECLRELSKVYAPETDRASTVSMDTYDMFLGVGINAQQQG